MHEAVILCSPGCKIFKKDIEDSFETFSIVPNDDKD